MALSSLNELMSFQSLKSLPITLKSLHSFFEQFFFGVDVVKYMSFNLYIGSAVGFRITEAVAPI